jgi:hypothetical protein
MLSSLLVGARKTYLLGFAHRVEHKLWVDICEKFGERMSLRNDITDSTQEQEGPLPERNWSNQTTRYPALDVEEHLKTLWAEKHPEKFVEDALNLVDKDLEEGIVDYKHWREGRGSARRGEWVRPAWDGLSVWIGRGRETWDNDPEYI